MRVGIAGITGRLGLLCASEVARHPTLELVGGLAREEDLTRNITSSISALAKKCDVIIDVSHASLVKEHAKTLSKERCAWVLGTTGYDDAAQMAIQEALAAIPILVAANFSPGLTLLLDIARRLGQSLPSAEYDADILETHHRQKLDAPSGTALAIGKSFAQGRGVDLPNVARTSPSGQRGRDEIGFAALRSGQIVGEHHLILTAEDEQITITHRAFDRHVFARGAIKAAIWLGKQPSGLYEMSNVLCK